jgi:hypothetical protein
MDFDTLSLLHAILEPLASFIDAAQTIGPCDTIYLSIKLLVVLRRLEQPSNLYYKKIRVVGATRTVIDAPLKFEELSVDAKAKWDRVDDVRKAIIRKILRRFLFGEFKALETTYRIELESANRKWNILANEFVLASFACAPAPYSNFQFLRTIGLVNGQSEAKALADRAMTALTRFVERVQEPQSDGTAENIVHGVELPDVDVTGGMTEQWQFDLELLQRGPTAGAFVKFIKSQGALEDREAYAKAAFGHFSRACTLGRILRLLLSKVLTTVKCETNFGLVQGLLSSARLNLGTKTLTGYYMINLNRDWVMRLPRQASPRLPVTRGESQLDQYMRSNAGMGQSYSAISSAELAGQRFSSTAASALSTQTHVVDHTLLDVEGDSAIARLAPKGFLNQFAKDEDDESIDSPQQDALTLILRSLVLPSTARSQQLHRPDVDFEEDANDFALDSDTVADLNL